MGMMALVAVKLMFVISAHRKQEVVWIQITFVFLYVSMKKK
jgi:hypothetical protein